MGLATVIIRAEGKPPSPYRQGHPLMNFRGGIEPPTRGFSVDRVTDSLTESMS